ncbi:MAG: mannose-1-phosphate guanylyltransferase/mannose-6-phosphate isomerase [Candidatus Gastranaerophilales bacterium]|nr:mannose-1-phosphate guanylyltransferase/mannose-6-phosphate isomerase [Candidatus Gastranaerophilales bacterium]
MSNLYSVILAGGSGSRLWPLSREMHPKHLMKMNDEYTLFQATFLRLINDVDDKNIITVTNIKHESIVKQQLTELKNKFCRKTDYKILTEPVGKNTASSIALSIKYISQNLKNKKEDPIILVVASDQLILDEKCFSKTINEGKKLAGAGYIVTFGIEPQKVDVGLGYIKGRKDKKIEEIIENGLKVADFIEKPELKEAEKLIKSKKYFWNSGIFMFKASTMMAELKKHCNDIYKIINKIDISNSTPSVPYQDFDKLPEISIDYALMEKSKKLAMVPMNCYWYDMGSWEAIYDISEKDENGNYITGNVIDIDSKNSMVYSTSKLVTTIGLEDTIVVETEDALLVCNKVKAQEVKAIYQQLKDKNDSAHLVHKTVYRPWGYYTVMQEGDGFLTKCIMVNSGAKLSLQLHHHRSEHWVVLEGKAFVVKGKENYELNPGESIDLAVEEIHSLQNPYKEPLKILEVQKGDILDENDIERIEDMYGRV